ncbi:MULTISPECIES: DUF2569 domain-containing protein [Paenibacillus]|uniref:DUF2569 domain-containing protein n=1 Tax=Paenibacillus TaxID=44249 RepID=UPI0015951395|nr:MULTISPECIES: DUF2569 domain-containing protein [Paenibacillus]
METKLQGNQPGTGRSGVSGLGGWLILVQIGLYATLIIALYELVVTMPVFSPETWNMITSKESEYYHYLWGPVIVYETAYGIILSAFCVFILIDFYARKAIVPKLMIIFYGGSLLLGIFDYILVMQIPLAREAEDGSTVQALIRAGFTSLIWIPYFLKSVRVKNTFVR